MPNRVITKGQIGNALESVAPDHILGVANDIFDEELQMYQSEINRSAGVYDISANHLVEGQPSTYTDLEDALGVDGANVPVNIRKGGMSVKFVQTSDNKYVQYRLLLSGSFTASQFANESNWAICDNGIYVDSNNEYLYVKVDANKRIILAVRPNGDIYFGAGVPQQVVDYIQEKIDELSLDEYEDIVAFLNGLEEGDKTLSQLLSEKVDKVDNKSLIDEDVANGIHYIENLEFINIWTDSERRILFALKTDGDVLFGCGIPSQIVSYVESKIAQVNSDISAINAFLSGITDPTLLEYLNSTYGEYIDSPEWRKVEVDSNGKILNGIKEDGSHYAFRLHSETLDELDSRKVEKEEGKSLTTNDYTNEDKEIVKTKSLIEDPEEKIEIDVDANNRLLSYRKKDGTKHEAKFEADELTIPNSEASKVFLQAMQDPENADALKTAVIQSGAIEQYKSVPLDLPKYGKLSIHTSDTVSVVNMPNYTDNSFKCLKGGTKDAPFELVEGVPEFSDDWEAVTYDSSAPEYASGTIYFAVDPMYHYDEQTGDMVYDWPATKASHYCTAELDFGSYFHDTLSCIVEFQGSSSLDLPKRNFRIKLYKNNTFAKKQKIKIGSLIKASSYNVKAYYRNPDKTGEPMLYRLYKEIRECNPYEKQYPWNTNHPFFTAATGICLNFPVRVDVNGDFYGVMWFGLKKDGDNYMLSDDADGMFLNQGGGSHTWLAFHSKDYDNVDAWDDELNDEMSQSNIDAMLDFYDFINNGVWTRENVISRFDIDSWIDYYIFVRVFALTDNYSHNVTIYSKADKQKMYIFLYDADMRETVRQGTDIPDVTERYNLVWTKFAPLFHDEIVARYWQLRNTILNKQHITNLFLELQQGIDYSDLMDEVDKWPNMDITNATGRDINNVNFERLDAEFNV